MPQTSSETLTGPQTATPSQSPSPPQLPGSQPPTAEIFRPLFTHVLQHNSALFSFPGSPITSTEIDNITHAMWQVAFKQGGLLQRACQYSALFSHLKLSALAKLNFLPSWWLLREMLVRELTASGGWPVDDEEMENVWKKTCTWAVNANKTRISMRAWGSESRGIVEESKTQVKEAQAEAEEEAKEEAKEDEQSGEEMGE
jgi:hypothetical protein